MKVLRGKKTNFGKMIFKQIEETKKKKIQN